MNAGGNNSKLTRTVSLVLLTLLTGSAACTLRLEGPPDAAPSASPAPDVDVEGEGTETVYDVAGRAAECARAENRVVPPIEGSSLEDQVKTIARAVELVRDLEFEDPPRSRLLTEDAFVAKSRSLVAAGYTPKQARIDGRVLELLGLLPPNTDLLELNKEVAGEQIGGFYLPKEETLYVPQAGTDLSPYDEIVVAHEFEHALADSALDLPKLSAKDLKLADESTARRALIEGDATMLMQQYATAAFTPQDAQELLSDPALTKSQEDAEDIPFVIRRGLEFPYAEGLFFACRLFLEGGWDAVDRAYERPPLSTAQILLPELYDRKVKPISPPKVSDPGKPWRRVMVSSFGLFDLTLLLQAPGGDEALAPDEGLDRAKEWAGGEMRAWQDGKDTAVTISIATEGERGSDPDLCAHLEEWHEDAFAPVEEVAPGEFESADRFAIIDCSSKGVGLAMAPSRATARELVG